MLVSRLEVFGFKSFLEKLSLPLSGGLTAVVGPNGCGKSNIVDALRWILGETKASSLRGGSLEDVIFNGTETLRPLGLAEVSITIRSEQGSLFDEILAQQKLMWQDNVDIESSEELPSSGSVEEPTLAADQTPVVDNEGRPKLSIIQGKKGQTDSEETAAVVAETAEGAVQAEDATQESNAAAVPETTATHIPESLRRFSWLSGISELQVTRRLYRSGESEFFLNKVACRLRDLKELFRIVGVAARGYTVVAQGEVTRLITAKPQERRLILEEAAGIAGFREKRSAAERRLEETGISISRLDDIIKEVSRQVNSLKVAAARATNRAQLKEDLASADLRLLLDAEARIGDTVQKAKSKDDELRSSEETLAAKASEIGEQELVLRNRDVAMEQELIGVRQTLETAHSILSGYVKNKSALESRKASVDSAIASIEREQKRTADRTVELQRRQEESKVESEQLQSREETLRKELSQLNSFDANELRNAEVALRESRQELQRKDSELRQIREKLVGEEARKKALDEQFESLHPRSSLTEIKKRLGNIRNDHPWVGRLEEVLGSNNLPIVAEIFSFDPGYAEALSAVLDQKADALLCEAPVELCGLYAKLAETKLAKECSSITAISTAKRQVPETIFTVGLSEDEKATNHAPTKIVGEKLRGKEFLSALNVVDGYLPLAEYLLRDVYLAASYEEAKSMLGECGDSERVVTLTGEVLSNREIKIRREGKNIVAIKGELESITQRCSELAVTVSEVTAQKTACQQKVQTAEDAHSVALKASQERQRRARELSSEHGVLLGKLHIAQRMRGQVENDLKNNEQQQQAFQNQVAQRAVELTDIVKELAAVSEQDESELEMQVQQAKETLKIRETEASGSRAELREKAKALQQTRSELDSVRRELSDASLALQRVTIELEARREQFVREYPETVVSEEKIQLEDAIVEELRAESQKLRARLIREGDVDPTAPERLSVEQARMDELEMQQNDLSTAAQALRDTIAELAETSRERFEKLFVSVAKNFSELVAKLFGGGAGELTMSDPSNPLESGIELYVRPPGKKPKSIDLLSGGEKTLCALALMISLFLERPSPLCVLDEVDAPLDEANLQRFVGLVKEMSTKTQFVMVTHNKQTMAVADRLIGVTMPQAGASKVLAVSLDEAYQAVA